MKQQQTIILIAGIVFLTGGIGLLSAKYMSSASFSLGSDSEYLQKIREADEYLRQNSHKSSRKSYEIFNQVLSYNHSPRINALSRYGLAMSLEKLKDYQIALDHYRKLKNEKIKDAALSEKVDFSLGKLYLYIDHEEDGRSLLEPLLVKTKNNKLKSRIHLAFGNFFLRANERKRAASNFRIALKYNPENLKAQVGKAEAMKGSRTEWLAYEYYDDYLIGDSWLDPMGRKKLLNQLREEAYQSGIISFRKGETGKAEHYFQRVIKENISDELNEKSIYWLAETYQKNGKTKLALETYESVLENSITLMDQPALIKKGILLFNQNKLEKSAKAFQSAIDNYPNGGYTERAMEWKREIRAQFQERELMRRVTH